MKLLRTTALTAALMTAAVPMLTSPAHAWGWGWRGGGWGWGGAGTGACGRSVSRWRARRAILRLRLWLPGLRLWLRLSGLRLWLWDRLRLRADLWLWDRLRLRRRPMVMVMAPATATRVTAPDMGPATAPRVTATLITPLSDAISMPPLLASGVIGATEPGEAALPGGRAPHWLRSWSLRQRSPGTGSQGFFARLRKNSLREAAK